MELDSHLQHLLKAYHAELAFLPIEHNGYLIKGKNGHKNQIIVNASLPDAQAEKVILHEIGHLKHDQDVVGSYTTNYIARCKSEKRANSYLVRELSKTYRTSVEKSDANYIALANYIGIGDVDMVKDILKDMYQKN